MLVKKNRCTYLKIKDRQKSIMHFSWDATFSKLTIKFFCEPFLQPASLSWTKFVSDIPSCVINDILNGSNFSKLQVQLWINLIIHFRQNALDVYLSEFFALLLLIWCAYLVYIHEIMISKPLFLLVSTDMRWKNEQGVEGFHWWCENICT